VKTPKLKAFSLKTFSLEPEEPGPTTLLLKLTLHTFGFAQVTARVRAKRSQIVCKAKQSSVSNRTAPRSTKATIAPLYDLNLFDGPTI
jgi:hypothetical protein